MGTILIWYLSAEHGFGKASWTLEITPLLLTIIYRSWRPCYQPHNSLKAPCWAITKRIMMLFKIEKLYYLRDSHNSLLDHCTANSKQDSATHSLDVNRDKRPYSRIPSSREDLCALADKDNKIDWNQSATQLTSGNACRSLFIPVSQLWNRFLWLLPMKYTAIALHRAHQGFVYDQDGQNIYITSGKFGQFAVDEHPNPAQHAILIVFSVLGYQLQAHSETRSTIPSLRISHKDGVHIFPVSLSRTCPFSV